MNTAASSKARIRAFATGAALLKPRPARLPELPVPGQNLLHDHYAGAGPMPGHSEIVRSVTAGPRGTP